MVPLQGMYSASKHAVKGFTDAILKAAVKPERDVKVGAGAVLNTTVAKLAPGLGDKISAKQADRQQYQEPPRDPQGTLYKAGESGRTHGSGGIEDKELKKAQEGAQARPAHAAK